MEVGFGILFGIPVAPYGSGVWDPYGSRFWDPQWPIVVV